MRLVGTFQNENDLRRFSEYLRRKKIDHSFEQEKVTDWGSDDYGTLRWRLWVDDEDAFENVYSMYQHYKLNPDDPIFPIASSLTQDFLPNTIESSSEKEDLFSRKAEDGEFLRNSNHNEGKPVAKSFGKITLFFLFLCSFIFFISGVLEPPLKDATKAVSVPIFLSPVNKELMFDYPTAWEIYEKLYLKYGAEALVEPSQLPPEGRILYQKANLTPYWKGAYDIIVAYIRNKSEIPEDLGPLFVKIREGEFWRLFTPALLHFDLFHLFFNMIWLIVLGRQIEDKIGPFRYLTLILVAGVISNIAQYLMSGPSFIGFSGVICAFIGFVYARQQIAPWEGYQLQRSTFLFILIFVFGIAAIQFFAFLLEILAFTNYSPPIASTAHITGGIAGYILGRLKWFSWKISFS